MKKYSLFISVLLISLFIITSCEKVDPNAPEACFVTPDEVVAGVPTAFNSSCSVNAVSFSWSFGDGDVSVEANPTHTYSEGGTYTVTLTTANAEGDTNEVSQSVTVATPSVIEHAGTIDADETWIEGVHLVTGDIYVDGAILTIEPGATVMFAANSGLYIGYHSGFSGATLIANGTDDKPITFTSAGATKTAGDWDFIGFYDGASSLSSMLYCVVEYGGGYSSNYGEIHIVESSVTIGTSTIRYSASYGISLGDDGFFQSFTGNILRENASNPISIYGNYAHTIGTGNTITTDTGVLVKGDEVENDDATWVKLTCAYVIAGDLYIESVTGAKLTLMPGVEVRMGNNTAINIGYHGGEFGTLIAEGTEGDHIRFTSAAPDLSRTAGDWDMIAFYGGAGSGSSFDFCDIEYGGGYSENYGMIYLDESSISLTNSSLKNSQFKGVTLKDDASFVACSGNTFEDNGTFPMEIYGNYVHTLGTGNTFNTGPGILVKNDEMEQADVTWLKHNIPYIVDGILYIESVSGAKLTIEPGTTIKFSEGSEIQVGYHSGEFGVLVADGEPGNQITFTSAAPDGFESAGDWDGIWFRDGTGNNTILDNCIISYGGGYSSNSGNLNIQNEAAGVPVISNCQIEHSAAWGIYMDINSNPTLTDNSFANNVSGDTN